MLKLNYFFVEGSDSVFLDCDRCRINEVEFVSFKPAATQVYTSDLHVNFTGKISNTDLLLT